jgi:hypothetical protein
MKRNLSHLVLIAMLGYATQSVGQTTYNGPTVETNDYRIELRPVGEDQFAVHLTDKLTGLREGHQFDGEGSNDPEPFLLVQGRYCDTPVILLTIKFPWRHTLPQFHRVLDTYAFRASDFAFIDMTHGPLTDIALADHTVYAPSEIDMLPPIKVRCLLGNDAKPFEFFEQEAK